MQHRDRAWATVTIWSRTAVAAIAAVLLLVLAYAGPSLPITEVDFSGARVFVARFAGAAFMAVLTLSYLLHACLLLPQRSANRPVLSLPAVLDLLVIAGVVVETALVLSVGFDDDPRMNAAILAAASRSPGSHSSASSSSDGPACASLPPVGERGRGPRSERLLGAGGKPWRERLLTRACAVALAEVRTNPLRQEIPPIREQHRLPVARITATTRRQIVALYQSGLSTRTVAQRTQTSKTTVLSVLAREHVAMRPTGRHY